MWVHVVQFGFDWHLAQQSSASGEGWLATSLPQRLLIHWCGTTSPLGRVTGVGLRKIEKFRAEQAAANETAGKLRRLSLELAAARDVLQLAGMGAKSLLCSTTKPASAPFWPCSVALGDPSRAFRPHPPAGDALLASSAAGLDRAGRAWPPRPTGVVYWL